MPITDYGDSGQTMQAVLSCLNGEAGASSPAINGVTLYAGAGVPNNATGKDGDLYFRSDGGAGSTIYQHRSGAWVATGA